MLSRSDRVLILFVGAAYVLVLAAATMPIAAFGQSTKSSSGDVWFWFGGCKNNSKTMEIELSVEGKIVYRSSFRACRMKRADANSKREGNTKIFYFPGGHTFQKKYRTTRQTQIKGSIWQAGADPDDVLLGVSFETDNQVLLNTVDIVRPGRPTQYTLDDDVVIKTYQVTSVDAPR
jgi:hypothetical protein